MHRSRWISVLAAVTALAAGCGAAGTSPSREAASDRQPITVVVAPGKHRFDRTELRFGDTVRCRGGAAGAMVPHAGSGVSGTADGVTSSSSVSVDNRGRVIVVECEVS
jgi:hypothetical protein